MTFVAGAVAAVAAVASSAVLAQAKLPADVARFVERRDGCDHFRGEEPYDKERRDFLRERVLDLCVGTDRRLAELKHKYRTNKDVAAKLDAYEARIEIADTGPDGLTLAEAQAFLLRLQRAVRADDTAAIARLVSYPLSVNRRAGKLRIANAQALMRDYPAVFTPEIRAAVLAQDPEALFRNWQGCMIGNGEAWFAGICSDQRCSTRRIRVIAINQPG